MSDTFVMSVVDSGTRHVVKLVGELDLATVEAFSAELARLDEAGAEEVELDLSELSFIDSSGVGAIVVAARNLRRRGAKLIVGERSAVVQRVLSIAGIEDALG